MCNVVNLAADKVEKGWWVARVEEGLRIMRECPSGFDAAAAQSSLEAKQCNHLLLCAVLVPIVTLMLVQNTFVYRIAAAAVTVMLCFRLFVFFSKSKTAEIPSLRVAQVVDAPPQAVFSLLMDSDLYHRYDIEKYTVIWNPNCEMLMCY